MKITIDKIQLMNWFNFKGEFEENEIKFGKGVNILVGDNNAGKTKLHNAFRWILNNEIVLEFPDGYKETPITEDNILKVFNNDTFHQASISDKLKLGVKVWFTEHKPSENNSYVLLKSVEFRKEIDHSGNAVKNFNSIEKTFKFNPRNKTTIPFAEKFSTISNKIIPKIYQNYFFIEGEQLGLMTPLEGVKLKTTINSLVDIYSLDHLETKSQALDDAISKEKKAIEIDEKDITEERKLNLENIERLENRNIELEKLIEENYKLVDRNKNIENKYKRKAEQSDKRKKLLEELEALKKNKEILESNQENDFLNYISSYIKTPMFNISRIDDDTQVIQKLDNQLENLKSWISERRIELNTRMTEDEQRMIMALEKSQPKPEILNEMVKEGNCFVCNNELSEKSKTYIKEKLIPVFRGEFDNDLEIEKLEEVYEVFRALKLESIKYSDQDQNAFEYLEQKIVDITSDLVEADNELVKFIEVNGELEKDHSDEINLNTYARAVEERVENESEIKKYQIEIDKNLQEIKNLDSDNGGSNMSEELKRAKELNEFTSKLRSFLTDLKEEKYVEFAENLQEKATKRFQEFMKFNVAAKTNSIRVDKLKGRNGEFEFKINVINKFGQIREQPGGADQALRRVAVVFGLLDYADSRNEYPFIADAPVSKLSPDTKLSFFKVLNDDPALSQTIVMTMDLWSAENQELNELGMKVKDYLSDKDDSKMILMRPKENNTGVIIE